MIQRFKGVTETFFTWQNSEKKIPHEVWAVAVIEGTVSTPIVVGLKIGDGRVFSETPWVYDPRALDNKIEKPHVETPSEIKFLNEAGEYVLIDLEGVGISYLALLASLDENNKELAAKEELDFLRDLMFVPPEFTSFSSTSPYIGNVETTRTVAGTIPVSFYASNPAGIASASISVNVGTWTGTGAVNVGIEFFRSLILQESQLTRLDTDEIVITLSGVDIKGNAIPSKSIKIKFTPRIYYGLIEGIPTTSSPLQSTQSFFVSSYPYTIEFDPAGISRTLCVLIPASHNPSDPDFRNFNAATVPHSLRMNAGGEETASSGTILINDLVYYVYLSDYITAGKTKCIIQ
jgi:hypothetical protein